MTVNKATENSMAGVEAAKKREQERASNDKTKTTIPTAKAEWVVQQLDLSKKTLTIPTLIKVERVTQADDEGNPLKSELKTYQVRKETLAGLVSLSKLFFGQHTNQLEKLHREYKGAGGGKAPFHGETRKYSLNKQHKGFFIPVHFIWDGAEKDRTGYARCLFETDRITVTIEKSDMPSIDELNIKARTKLKRESKTLASTN